jgi:hypothetical protein
MMGAVQPLAFVFGQYPPPLRRGHLPLADLTVLLGPNDAGKSRTLGALGAVLEGGAPARGAAVIAECGPDERALLGARLGASALEDEDAPLVIVEPADGAWQLSSGSFDRCYSAADLGAEGLPGWAQLDTPIALGEPLSVGFGLVPRAMTLPASFDAIRARVEEVVATVVMELAGHRGDTNGWLQTSDAGRTARVHPLAAAITRRFGREVTSALPGFISRKYELVCEVPQLVDWPRAGRSRLMLRSTRDNALFTVEDAAAGFRIWIQLALCETLRRLERQLAAVRFSTSPDTRGSVAEVAWDPGALDYLASSLARDAATHPAQVLEGVLDALRPWVYLIDEPEQHLHPALIRRAARWLANAMQGRGAHAVAVTHSADFLAEDSGAFLVYVERGEHETLYRPFDFATLVATDRIAAEMGFDRGELLTRVRVVLYVEGAMDRVVLDELFGAELSRKGIALGVFGGVANVKDVLEHPVVRYTAAHIAVLVDAVALDEARRIRDDPELRRSLLTGTGERPALARVIEAARQRDRVVEPFGIEARDIFMVLDDEPLREIAPQWPGQREAEECWLEYRQGGGRKGFKRYYKDRWDLPVSIPTCRQAARRMAQNQSRPSELVALVDELERLGST